MFGIKSPIDKLAKQAGSIVTNAREILEYNPSLMSLALPPQVSMGLKIASEVGGMVGVKIPNEDDLRNLAQGQVDKILGGIRKPILAQLANLEGELQGTVDRLSQLNPEEVLKSIDWLK